VEGLGWTPASALCSGQELRTEDGRSVRVVGGGSVETTETVYNFEVEGWHTYFVGRADVLVHNGCPDCGGTGTAAEEYVTREERWMQLANEEHSTLPKEVIDHINRTGGTGVSNRFGLELAHQPGKSAAQGYDYAEALPKFAADHRGIQHRYLRETKNGTVILKEPKPRSGGKLDLPPEGALP
jgi:hypothetical protein